MSGPAFGLYRDAGCSAGARVAAGESFTLGTPTFDAGVPLFRRSLWLPLAAGLAQAQALSLGADAFNVHFAPVRLAVSTGTRAWFSAVQADGSKRVRLTMTLPAPVLQFRRATGAGQYQLSLFRADGDSVADEAAQSGRTGVDLDEPWVGAGTVVELGAQLASALQAEASQKGPVAFGRPARALAPGGIGGATAEVGLDDGKLQVATLSVVSQVVIDGKPTSPRLRLLAEPASGEPTLLWHAMQAGPQAGVDLPGEALANAWGPALAQLSSLLEDPATAPLRLRLDLESDLPCTVSLNPLALALDADFELLEEAARFDFDGTRAARKTLSLALPGTGTPQRLVLTGRAVADAAAGADGGGHPADGRQGALATPERVLRQRLTLSQPMRLAGATLAWQPLSETVRGEWRLLADDGRPLATQSIDLETPVGGWLALRRAALDLQAQSLWLELALAEGSGLWLFADGGGEAGRVDGRPLPMPLWWAPLAGGGDVAGTTRPLTLSVGPHAVAGPLAAGPLVAALEGPALSLLATTPITVTGGVAGSVTVESALARVRLA